MKKNSPYEDAQLMVAAIRVLEYKKSAPPSLEEICELLSYSVEYGGIICRNLKNLGILGEI